MPTLLLRVVFFLGLSLSAGALRAGEAARVFRAGADRADITPELGTLIVGNFVTPAATYIHDPLYARTLVLDDGATKLVFVICDNVGIPQVVCDEAKRLITQRTGIPGSHVLIASTHTHSAGSARERGDVPTEEIRDGFVESVKTLAPYQVFLSRRIVDSVRNALARLQPAKIAWGAGSEPSQVFNRRWHVKSEALRRNPFGGIDTVRMNPPSNSDELLKPAGPTDPEIAFLSVVARDTGKPLALLANYSLHYVGGVPAGAISGDYFGAFAERIGELLGAGRSDPPFVGILSNGTSADINNVNFRQRAPGRPPYEQMRHVADLVAKEVQRVHATLVFQDWVKLDARYTEITLSPRRPTAEMLIYARERLAAPASTPPWHPNEKIYLNRVLEAEKAPASLRVPLQAFRVGELGITAMPIETFVEVGLELKAKTPFAKTFTISIANGAFGYMPTAEQHKLGGYETWLGTNRVEFDAAGKMVTQLLAMLREMQPQ